MIRVLDQHTIDKIAAGEVIERPSSVVKELVENSIDAGSSRVTVEIIDGGTTMIRVTDNGSGIEEGDVRKAFISHATSKLDTIDDLFNISSLGFRGEALSTIAAVSKVEMITKTREAVSGYKYVIHGGKEVSLEEVGAPDGTTIISRNIFYNTPARLKFLKSNMTEGSYINDLMSHIALSHPEVAIKLISGGKTIIDTRGDGRLKETIYSLYGKEITQGLLDVDYEKDDIKITGYVGKPFLSKGNRSFENYYVNGRYVKSAVVNKAIEEAYKTHIMQHKFPYTALFIELPTYMVDINVHPAKKEFRFDDEKALFSSVFHAVADALTDKVFIPDTEADYKTKQTIFSPVKQETDLRESASFGLKTDVKDEAKKDASDSIKEKYPDIDKFTDGSGFSKVDKDSFYKPADTSPVSKADGFKRVNLGGGQSFNILESLLPKEYREQLKEAEESEEAKDSVPSENIQESITKKVEYKQEELTETRYLSEVAMPEHKIIGLAFDTYWITQYEDSLYIMDQHAAHEKVNYEQFLADFKARKFHSQNLFPPEVINLSSSEKTAVMNNQDYLKDYGFEFEDFGGNDVKLTAVPTNMLSLNVRDVFLELAAYVDQGITGVTEDIFVHRLATMGCKAAIKGNQKITIQEAQILIDRLMKLDNPYTCPHGRPTIVKMTKEELDKKFKRIVD